jgi:hypothetical protein
MLMFGDHTVRPRYHSVPPSSATRSTYSEFGADHGGGFVHQRRIPRRGHADGLRKHRGRAGARDPVQTLVPPIVSGHAQARDRRRDVADLRGLLLKRHARHQIRRPFLRAQRRIAVRERGPVLSLRRRAKGGDSEHDGRDQMLMDQRALPTFFLFR